MAKKENIGFPVPDSKFDVAFKALMDYLAKLVGTQHNWERLGLNAITVYNQLMIDLTGWCGVIAPEKTKGTKTATLRAQKDTFKNHALGIIRPIRVGLKMTDKVNPGFLTDEDKQYFYIIDPTAYTFGQAPKEIPQITIEKITHLGHLLRIVDKEHPKSKALPDDAEKIEVRRFIGIAAPTSEAQYSPYVNIGKFHVDSTFTVADANKLSWYIARFVSYRGDPGEWSASESCTITAIGSALPPFPTLTPAT